MHGVECGMAGEMEGDRRRGKGSKDTGMERGRDEDAGMERGRDGDRSSLTATHSMIGANVFLPLSCLLHHNKATQRSDWETFSDRHVDKCCTGKLFVWLLTLGKKRI